MMKRTLLLLFLLLSFSAHSKNYIDDTVVINNGANPDLTIKETGMSVNDGSTLDYTFTNIGIGLLRTIHELLLVGDLVDSGGSPVDQSNGRFISNLLWGSGYPTTYRAAGYFQAYNDEFGDTAKVWIGDAGYQGAASGEPSNGITIDVLNSGYGVLIDASPNYPGLHVNGTGSSTGVSVQKTSSNMSGYNYSSVISASLHTTNASYGYYSSITNSVSGGFPFNSQYGVYSALSTPSAASGAITSYGLYGSATTGNVAGHTNYGVYGIASGGNVNHGVIGISGGSGYGVYSTDNMLIQSNNALDDNAHLQFSVNAKTATVGVSNASGSISSISVAGDTAITANTTGADLILSAKNSTGDILLTTGATDSRKATLENDGLLRVDEGTLGTNNFADAAGDAYVEKDFENDGIAYLATLINSGNASIGGTLGVTGISTFTGVSIHNGGAAINDVGVSDNSLVYYNRFLANTAIGNQNWADYSVPTVTGTPTVSLANGRIGTGMNFDESDDLVSMGDKYDIGTNNRTISAWIKTTDADGSVIVSKRPAGTAIEDGYDFVVNTSGKLQSYLGDGTFGVQVTDTGAAINDGAWHHVALVHVLTSAPVLYVDGIARTVSVTYYNTGGGGIGGSGPTTSIDTSNGLFIGGGSSAGSFWRFAGQIDEVQMWDRAFSASEIRALYSLGQEFIQEAPEQRVYVRARRTTTQSIANDDTSPDFGTGTDGTNETIIYATEIYDTANAYDATTGRFTAPIAGYYAISATCAWAVNSTGIRSIGLYVGGTEMDKTTLGAWNGVVSNLVSVASIYLAAGDTVDVRVLQNSGGALNLSGNNNYDTVLTIARTG